MSGGYAYQKGRQQDAVKLMEAEVWACTGDSCKGWMRRDLSFQQEPACPLCGSAMELSVRQVPKLMDQKE